MGKITTRTTKSAWPERLDVQVKKVSDTNVELHIHYKMCRCANSRRASRTASSWLSFSRSFASKCLTGQPLISRITEHCAQLRRTPSKRGSSSWSSTPDTGKPARIRKDDWNQAHLKRALVNEARRKAAQGGLENIRRAIGVGREEKNQEVPHEVLFCRYLGNDNMSIR